MSDTVSRAAMNDLETAAICLWDSIENLIRHHEEWADEGILQAFGWSLLSLLRMFADSVELVKGPDAADAVRRRYDRCVIAAISEPVDPVELEAAAADLSNYIGTWRRFAAQEKGATNPAFIADETSARILRTLKETGHALKLVDIAAAVDKDVQTVSARLRQMEQAGIVTKPSQRGGWMSV